MIRQALIHLGHTNILGANNGLGETRFEKGISC